MKNLRQLFCRSGSPASQKRRRRAEAGRSEATQRRLSNEVLEKRELLAADIGHNEHNAYDVNYDGRISASDAGAIINRINVTGEAEQVADPNAKKMYPDVNNDGQVTASDALGVINAMSRGEEVGELIELLISARDLNDDQLPVDGNGDVNVQVGQPFDIEISYDDLRVTPPFEPRQDLGAFQLFVDITTSQSGVLSPILNETQRLIIDESLIPAVQAGDISSVTFSIPESPPGISGDLSYESPIIDFGNGPADEVANALMAFGYTSNQFDVSTLDFGNDDLGFQIKFIGDQFGNVDLPNISVEVNETGGANIPTQEVEFAPFEDDGVTPNSAAVRFNINTFSRTFNDNEQFYTAQNRGELAPLDAGGSLSGPLTGFDGVGGLGMVPISGGGIPELTNDGSFVQPFDAFSLRVFLNQPVTDLVIGVNPGEDPEATLLYGQDDAVPQDMVKAENTDTNGNGVAIFTINAVDDIVDPTVSVTVSPDAVLEDGSGTLTYTFTRSGDDTEALSVSYDVGGTADAGADYTALPGTVTIGAGASSATVTVNPTDDDTVEADETIILTVTDGSNYDVGSPSSATGTITNDDVDPTEPTVSVAVSPTAVLEDGSGELVYTFSRAGDTSQALSVSYTVGGTATSGTDFAALSGTVSIPAGQSIGMVSVNPTDDSTQEQDETIILTVTDGSNYNVGSPSSATGTITDDDDPTADPTVSVNVSPSAVLEDGSGTLTYTFTRSGDSSQALSVMYGVSGTATPGTDFASLSGTVSIGAGQTTGTVLINPTDDSIDEQNETIILSVIDGSNYDVGSPSSATGTITDDDGVTPDPTVSVSVSPSAVLEDGSGTLTYTFSRSGDSSQALSVSYSVGGTATQGSDYTSLSGTVSIGAGQTSNTVSINPTDDGAVEPDETIILTVIDGSNYDVGSPSSATGTITNDDQVTADPTVSVSVSPSSIAENSSGSLTYTFSRSGDSSQALSVTYSVSGSATSGVDFVSPSGSVSIGAGSTSATVSISPIDDVIDESNESVVLTVLDGSNYDVGSPSSASGLIIDNDPTGPGSATISGFVFIDELSNPLAAALGTEDPIRNHSKDFDETGVGGVEVFLDGGGLFLSTITDIHGMYSFDGLVGGTYDVTYNPDSSALIIPRDFMSTHVVSVPTSTSSVTGMDFPLLGTTGPALSTVDILASSYLRTNGDVSSISNHGVEGGRALLDGSGNQEFIVIGDGYDGVTFAEIALNDARDAALLTILEGDDVLSARLSEEHFVLSEDGRGIQFFGDRSDHIFFDLNGDSAERDEFGDFRRAIDEILGDL